MTMKAVGYHHNLPIGDAASLEDLEIPAPQPGPRDLLVRVKAIAVNPVDTKVRAKAAPEAGQVKVLGWDAVGMVEALGADASGFAVGDRVWYAGAIDRPGANSELHVVDARLAARAPASLGDAAAAALPLTAITAWELLFERLGISNDGSGDNGAGKTLLVVGGAGGVGSILIQLARKLTQLQVVATASRPETRQWCLDLGAHTVIDHSAPMAAQLRDAGIGQVAMVAALTNTGEHLADLVECLAPQGKLALIDDPRSFDVSLLKQKSISLHWELMFTRSLFQTADMGEQGALLARVAALVDAGTLRSTLDAHYGAINAANLQRAHALIESGKARGKIVLEGF
jgi:zinc-binding alcohol dehydrogenase family protein